MITRIWLDNFKAFQRLDLPLAPLTLLAGANAVGKSTIMQAMALLRQSFDANMLTTGGGFLLNGGLIELGVGQDVLHEDYLTESNRDCPHIGIGLQCAEAEAYWEADYRSLLQREADVLPLTLAPAEVSNFCLFADGFQYLKADRISPSVHYPKSYEVAVRKGFLGANGEHTANYLRVRGDDRITDPHLRHPTAKSAALLDQTDAWFQTICPGVNLQAEDLRGTDLVRLSYGFFGNVGLSSSMRYRPTNVGFGLSYVLPVVVACLASRPGQIILLENPEAHLHPRGQTAITNLICRAATAGAQVIIETHSDHVLNAVRLSVKDRTLAAPQVAMHYFDRDGKSLRISSPRVEPNGMLSSWPEGFFDEWDQALDRLID